MSHTGIRLRLSIREGVLLEVDSDFAHHMALLRQRGPDCGPDCSPLCSLGCDEHGWVDLLKGIKQGAVKIEIKPVTLADPEVDDDECGGCPRCECTCGARNVAHCVAHGLCCEG